MINREIVYKWKYISRIDYDSEIKRNKSEYHSVDESLKKKKEKSNKRHTHTVIYPNCD